jgi:hypothetical protein
MIFDLIKLEIINSPNFMKFQRMTIWGPKSKHKVEKEKDKEEPYIL